MNLWNSFPFFVSAIFFKYQLCNADDVTLSSNAKPGIRLLIVPKNLFKDKAFNTQDVTQSVVNRPAMYTEIEMLNNIVIGLQTPPPIVPNIQQDRAQECKTCANLSSPKLRTRASAEGTSVKYVPVATIDDLPNNIVGGFQTPPPLRNAAYDRKLVKMYRKMG